MNWQIEFFDNLRRSARLQITSMIVLTGCLFITLTLLTVHSNLESIFSGWTKNLKMTAYIDPAVKEKQEILKKIEVQEGVDSARIVSKEEYKKQFDESLIKSLPKLKALRNISNPFHDGVEIQITQKAGVSDLNSVLDKISSSIEKIAGISEVSFGRIWIKEYSRLSDFVGYSSLFIIGIFLLTLSFIVGNAVKTLLDSRRDEIHIMSIIGATNTTIFKPYYANIFMLITTSYVLALTLSSIFKAIIESLFSHHLKILNIGISFPSAGALLFIYLLAMGFSFLGTYFHLLRLHQTRYKV